MRRDDTVGLGQHVIDVHRKVQWGRAHFGVFIRRQRERRPARDQPALAAEARDFAVGIERGEPVVEMATAGLAERDLRERSFGR